MTKLRPRFFVAAAVAGSLVASQAQAQGTTVCTATLSQVAQDSGGTVLARLNGYGAPFHICNVEGSFHTIAANTCRAWLSKLLTAYGTKRVVEFQFNRALAPNANMSSTCSGADFDWFPRIPSMISVLQ
jgi:uncharacterized protein YjbI with pentapeptide repeats